MKQQHLSLFTSLAAIGGLAQAQDWVELHPTNAPSLRSKHSMSAEGGHGRVLLFGGADALGAPLGDTWIWNGVDWSEPVTTASPSARAEHAIAYDRTRARVLLFGGTANGNWLGDTWQWNGSDWTELPQTVAPSARAGHALVYDQPRGLTVLHGGRDATGDLGDQWSFDGLAWSAVPFNGGPGARFGHAIACAAARGKLVLYGGTAAGSELGDTWEWDGASWAQVTTATTPGARTGHGLVFDSLLGTTVLHGGRAAGNTLSDSWTFDGLDWAPLTGTAPQTTAEAAVAFDPVLGKTVLFPNTWQLSLLNVTATVTRYGDPCGAIPLQLDPLPGTRPILGAAQFVDITNIPFGLAFMAYGGSNTQISGAPLPMSLAPFGMPGCSLYHDLVDFALPMVPVTFNHARYTFRLPYSSVYLGAHIYLQSWALTPGYNVGGLIASNALDLVLGNQ